MPISFACPSCDFSYQVRDEYAGRDFKCKSCGKAIQVPAGAGALARKKRASASLPARQKPARSNRQSTEEFAPLRRQKYRPAAAGSKKKNQSSRPKILMIGGIVGGLLVLLGGIGLLMMPGQESAPTSTSSEKRLIEANQPQMAPSDSGRLADDRTISESEEPAVAATGDSPKIADNTIQATTSSNRGLPDDELTWNVEIEVPAEQQLRPELLSKPMNIRGLCSKYRLSTTYSPFVAFDYRESFSSPEILICANLESCQILGQMTPPAGSFYHSTISPNGKYLLQCQSAADASMSPDLPAGQVRSTNTDPIIMVKVYSLETGTEVRTFQLPAGRQVMYADFGDNDSIIIQDNSIRDGAKSDLVFFKDQGYQVRDIGPVQTVEVPPARQNEYSEILKKYSGPKMYAYDLRSGEVAWVQPCPSKYSLRVMAESNSITPDRKYLILRSPLSTSLVFFDWRAQTIAGVITYDEKTDDVMNESPGWAFSRDGKTFVLIRSKRERDLAAMRGSTSVQFYDMGTGKLVKEFPLPELSKRGDANPAIHQLDKPELWLVNSNLIMDTETGRIVSFFGFEKDGRFFDHNLAFTSKQLILFVNQDKVILPGGIGFNDANSFYKVPLIDESIRNTVEAYRTDIHLVVDRGTKLGIKIEFEDPDAKPGAPAYDVISLLLKKKIELAGMEYDENSDLKLSIYHGNAITKAAYERNKTAVRQAPGEVMQQIRSTDPPPPNAIVGIEDSDGRMVWGEALGLHPHSLEFNKMKGTKPASTTGEPLENALKKGWGLRMLFDLQKVPLPVAVPGDSQLSTLPIWQPFSLVEYAQ